MPLIVEDGTGVANANSYITLAVARTYASLRGIVLSVDDPTLTAQVILAADFLESFAQQYVGSPTLFTQSLSWPRQGVLFDPNNPYPNNQIPIQLLNAQCEAVIAETAGIILQPTTDYGTSGFVVEEKVDVLTTKYSEHIGTSGEPILRKVMACLVMLLNPAVAIKTVRV